MKKLIGTGLLAIILLLGMVGCIPKQSPQPTSAPVVIPQPIPGINGVNGINGRNGTDGVGISWVEYASDNGTLILHLTNGSVFITGDLRGAKGDSVKGDKGDTGARGIRGESGSGGFGASGASGATGARGLSAPILRMVQKDTDWNIINGSTGGMLQYTPSGRTFGYTFTGFGLTPDTAYSLIYYADFTDRLNTWGGNNPGALIASGISDAIGGLHLIGSVALGISLPTAPDANISIYGYSGAPDYYPNAHGAKIWLVPSSGYDATLHKLTVWQPDTYLFETDLINYAYTP